MLVLIEFAYDNSYQPTIQMASCKPFYRRKYRSPLYQDEIGERDTLKLALGLKMTQKMIEDVRLIKERMKQTQDCQRVMLIKGYKTWSQRQVIQFSSQLSSIQILDKQVKQLRNKQIPLVKVLQRNYRVKEITQEVKYDIRQRFPQMFQ